MLLTITSTSSPATHFWQLKERFIDVIIPVAAPVSGVKARLSIGAEQTDAHVLINDSTRRSKLPILKIVATLLTRSTRSH